MAFIARFFRPFFRRRSDSLIRTRGPESLHQQEIEEDAAADVATVEQDDRYFPPDAPANDDELLPQRRRGGLGCDQRLVRHSSSTIFCLRAASAASSRL
jgi:hypothetical protein